MSSYLYFVKLCLIQKLSESPGRRRSSIVSNTFQATEGTGKLTLRTILIIWLAIIPASVMGVDFAAMEAVIEALEKPVVDEVNSSVSCDYTLADRVGRILPSDFDFCQPGRQSSLLNNGLYISKDGIVKPLPAGESSKQTANVVVPLPIKEDVALKPYAPFVIDLEQPRSNSPSKTAFKANMVAVKPSGVAPPISTSKLRSGPVFGCRDFQTFAHRGSAEQPENSIQSVRHALQSGHNGVEIDVQQLKDGQWVVHHDLSPGRVTYGADFLITEMDSYQWRKVRLKSRLGTETDDNAPFLDELLTAYRKSADASQKLNIEIKGGLKAYSCSALAALNQSVLAKLPQSQFIYSSRSVEHLRCLRVANPNTYLGLVIDPHPNSIDVEKSSKLSRVVSAYDKIKGASASENMYLNNSNRIHLKRSSFEEIRDLIGPYYGLHIDYRDYWGLSSGYSGAKGRLILYQLEDDRGLIALLKDIKRQQKRLPDAVLIDSELDSYCRFES